MEIVQPASVAMEAGVANINGLSGDVEITAGNGISITESGQDIIVSVYAVDNEIVSGTGTSWTLANVPITGTEHIHASGQRLTPGAGNDYTISGASITTANSYASGSLLADYRL